MGDTISRSAVLKRLEYFRRNYGLKAGYYDAMTDAIGEVGHATALDAALVVHARWIPKPIIGDCIYACSNCDKVRDAYCEEDGNFCAKCGAKMDEKEKTGE